jgi:hypothetical protein
MKTYPSGNPHHPDTIAMNPEDVIRTLQCARDLVEWLLAEDDTLTEALGAEKLEDLRIDLSYCIADAEGRLDDGIS